MQVRSLSIKTTEILQLELALLGEAESLIEELDAIAFSIESDDTSKHQYRAMYSRIQSLLKLITLLPEKGRLANAILKLRRKCTEWHSTPSDNTLNSLVQEIERVRSALRGIPKKESLPPPYRQPARTFDSSIPATKNPSTRSNKPLDEPSPQPKESLTKIQKDLQKEFATTCMAVDEILQFAQLKQELQKEFTIPLGNLFKHTTRLFEEMHLTAQGKQPAPRLRLERIPCMIVHIGGMPFAIPRQHIVQVIDAHSNDYRLRRWDIQGGSCWNLDGKLIGEISVEKILNLPADSKQDQKLFIQTLTSHGSFLIKAETEGLTIPLIPDPNTVWLGAIGPFIGASVPYAYASSDYDSPIVILDLEKMTKKMVASTNKSNSNHTNKTKINISPKSGISSLPSHLIAKTFNKQYIAVPSTHISHVAILHKEAILEKNKKSYLNLGTATYRALDPDSIVSNTYLTPPHYPEYLQCLLLNTHDQISALLIDEVIDQKTLSIITDFGFAPRPGIRGTGLVDHTVVSVLDPYSLPKT